jgi:glycosyltransferase involved in cell wall biosynthesis
MKIVCIPAYNEEEIIAEVITKCKKFSDKIIVCDDGSTDNTSKIAQQEGAIVINHKKNMGKGAALRTLFKISLEFKPDVIITIDGDGQFLPEEIPKLVQSMKTNNADIVIGYRFSENADMPKYRQFGNTVLDKITNLASDLPYRDTQSGFRAYSKKAVERISFFSDGFGADSEIIIDAAKKGLKIVEEPVKVIYKTGHKTSTKNPISHSSDVLTSLIELIAVKHPLKFLGMPGIIFCCIGIIFTIIVISFFNETRVFSIPSTLIALGTIILGMMLLLMSIVLFSINRIMSHNIPK